MRLDKLKEHFGDRVEIERKAFLLRTGPRDWEREDFINYTQGWARPMQMEPGLQYNPWVSDEPQPHSSIEAQVAYKVLEELAPDKAKVYHDLITAAYFTDNRDISDPANLTALAVDAGVDAVAFNEAIATRAEAMQELVFEEYKSAVEMNITGIPTVIFENQYLVNGAQSLETYEEIVQKLEKEIAEAEA